MKYMIYPWQNDLWKYLESSTARMPHALLIHGPEGIGKLALAQHLSQALLCEADDRSVAPCGRCEGCRWFVAGSHPDFRLVGPETIARTAAGEAENPPASPAKAGKPSQEIKVDQVRALDGFLSLGSHREGRRVTLVHPAEAMNPNAANALLKAIEEPPGGALFILVSHRPARLLPTVRSRCVAIPVSVPEATVAQGWLAAQGTQDAAFWLAYAGGAPLRALRYATEAAPALRRSLKALEGRDLDTLGSVNDREQLEALAEVLQKYALDKALASLCGQGRFSMAAASGDPFAWLRFARLMGRHRALARHPVNPRLFAGEMLRGMPKD
jgi:DNA polymerase III subunit delta'